MEFKEYQTRAQKTDQFSRQPQKITHPLLNLTEAVGVLHRLLEQGLREKTITGLYERELLTTKIGDCLWYLTNIADRRGLQLSDVAKLNLKRTQERWSKAIKYKGKLFDDGCPIYEKLPRTMTFAFFEPNPRQNPRKVIIAIPTTHREWIQIGDRVDDNSSVTDGYRYHDVLHLAHVAYLGWSPVIRALLKRKRKSKEKTDRVDDGARAINIEEALTAFVFSHAKQQGYYANTNVDFTLLKMVERLTHGLEVAHRSYEDWENAIKYGYRALQELKQRKEALVKMDIRARLDTRLKISKLPASVKANLRHPSG